MLTKTDTTFLDLPFKLDFEDEHNREHFEWLKENLSASDRQQLDAHETAMYSAFGRSDFSAALRHSELATTFVSSRVEDVSRRVREARDTASAGTATPASKAETGDDASTAKEPSNKPTEPAQ
jgi:hypothetical protein